MIRSGTPATWPTPTPVRRRTQDCEVWEDEDDGTFLARRGTVTLRVPPTVLVALFAEAVAAS